MAYAQSDHTYSIWDNNLDQRYHQLIYNAFQNWMDINTSLHFDQTYSYTGITIQFTNTTYQTTICNDINCMITVPIKSTDCNGITIHTSDNQIINLVMHEIGHYLGIQHNTNTSHLMYDINTTKNHHTRYNIPNMLDDNYFIEQLPIIHDINKLDDQLEPLYKEQQILEEKQRQILSEYGLTPDDIKDNLYSFRSSIVIRLSDIHDDMDDINLQINNVLKKRNVLLKDIECFLNIKIINDDITFIPINSRFRPITYYISDIDDKETPNMQHLTTLTHTAFNNWQSINPTLTFIETQNANAHILIIWDKFVQPEHLGLADCDYRYDYNCIVHISLGNTDCTNTFINLDDNTIRNTIEHEIGHVLGLGHHKDISHLMYGNDSFVIDPFDNLGFNMPEQYDYYYVGQKTIFDEMYDIELDIISIDNKLAELEQRLEDTLDMYGFTLSDLEYMGYVIDDDSFRDRYNSIVHEMNYIITSSSHLYDKYNELYDKYICYPNVL